MIVDKVLLEEVAKRKKHTFISTGMSKLSDIEKAVEIFQNNGTSFELMHCVSTYPTKEKDINLNTIPEMKKFNCNIGYSGHENGIIISVVASMYNITSLERHITLDKTMYGSDQAASIEFSEMKKLVELYQKFS